MRVLTGLALVLAGLLAAGAHLGAGEHAYVLDSGAKLLVEVDLTSGRRVASLPLEGSPAWLDDDGRHVVVFDRGAGEDKDERGWKASGRSSVTIVDAASLKAIGRVELGSGLATASFVGEGRLAALCPSYEAKKPGRDAGGGVLQEFYVQAVRKDPQAADAAEAEVRDLFAWDPVVVDAAVLEATW